MLVLTRGINQSVEIDDGRIVVTVLSIENGQVRIGIEAPRDLTVHRSEVAARIRREQRNGGQP